jgi:peroxiredoxin
MRSACAPVIASLVLGCTLNASTQPPDQADATATAPAAGAEVPGDAAPGDAAPGTEAGDGAAAPDAGAAGGDAGSSEPVAAGTSTPTASGGAGELTSGVDEPSPNPDDGTKTAPEPEPTKPVVAVLELPKPLHGKLDAACGNDPGVGERLKAFSLPGIEGDEPVTQGTFRGRVLVVNFWGTWCKPCLKELPEFDQLYRRYRKHGMTLLAIATDEDAKAVEELVTERKWGAKIAIAGEAYAQQYGSAKFPFTFVVDHKGVIQASYRGYKPECLGQLEADIREQLTVRAEAKAKRKKG